MNSHITLTAGLWAGAGLGVSESAILSRDWWVHVTIVCTLYTSSLVH